MAIRPETTAGTELREIGSKSANASRLKSAGDRRIRRSRATLTAAFTELALQRGYPNIGIQDVVDRADVGRSTLYAHFSGKADLLAHSLDTHLSLIADCTLKPELEPRLVGVIEHFWLQRNVARTMLGGDAGVAISRLLVQRLEQALVQLRRAGGARSTIDARLVAEQLAAGQLAVLKTWLGGRASASPREIAHLLQQTSYAAAMA